MAKQVVVTPGMFSQVEYKASWKSPIVMAVLGVFVLYFFGLSGRPGLVAFELSEAKDFWLLPDWVVPSAGLNIVLGSALLLIAAGSAVFTLFNRKTPVYLTLLYGLLAAMGLLAFLAVGKWDEATGTPCPLPVSYILGSAILLAVPIILGALGGIMSERVGVVNIAIEGQLLTGAFLASVIGSVTKNLWIGLIAAVITSAILSMALASLAIKYLVDQIIIGVLINVLVIGVTNFLYAQWLAGDGPNSNHPGTFPVIDIPYLSELPIIGPALFSGRITGFLTYALIALVWFLLFRTKLGLRARAVGEHPLAADSVGINVGRTRFWWVTGGGAIAGLGGAALTIGSVGDFGREMSGGLGFIALAVVILGRWHPFYSAASALLFGFAIILRVWANQVSPGIPTDFITMVPYLVTLVAVAGFAGKVRAPAASGQPYVKG